MVKRVINIEGVVDELPDTGWATSISPVRNEKILGLIGLFALFLLTVDWGSVFGWIPFHLLGIDIWVGMAIVLLLVLRFLMIVKKAPVGGNCRGGFYASSKGKALFFYDMVGDMLLAGLFCLLVWLRNPLVFLFASLMIFGRFKKGGGEVSDVQNWYPEHAN
jgi:hypothetical protein